MQIAAWVVAGIVATLHAGFFWLESIAWQQPTGLKVFRMDATQAAATATLAKNQGAYNLLLALAIGYAIARCVQGGAGAAELLATLLVFVIGAGVVGAITVSSTIFVVQAVPALVALGLLAAASR